MAGRGRSKNWELRRQWELETRGKVETSTTQMSAEDLCSSRQQKDDQQQSAHASEGITKDAKEPSKGEDGTILSVHMGQELA